MIPLFLLLPASGFIVDERPVDGLSISGNFDSIPVPMDIAVKELSAGRVAFQYVSGTAEGSFVDRSGRKILTLPVEPLRPRRGEVAGTEGHVPNLPGRIGEVPIATCPGEREIDGKTVVVADLREIAGWLGAGLNDTGSGGYEATTAPAWESLLGLAPREGVMPLDLVGDFGVSPPAQSFVLWARVRRPAWVQIYSLNENKGPEPMFGVDPLTGKPTTGTRGGLLPQPRAIAAGESARVPTMFGRRNPGVALYAALFLREDPGVEDPLEAIEAGRIKPGDYAVVGLRQRIGRMPLTFKNVVVKADQSLAELAKASKNDPDLLRAFNGLAPTETVPAGTVLVIPEQANYINTPLPDCIVGGTGYAEGGETLRKIAERWKVSLADAMDANPGFNPDDPLAAGEMLTELRPKKAAEPSRRPSSPPVPRQDPEGKAVLNRAVALRPAPDAAFFGKPILRGTSVNLLGRAGNYVRVDVKGTIGFIDKSNLMRFEWFDKTPSSKRQLPNSPLSRPVVLPNASPIVREALRYYGTPYDWGGASLTRGIDCSHFVSAIYNRFGLRLPPPVTTQEEMGALVHWKTPGMAVRRSGTRRMPSQPANLASLRPGDRFIIQRGLNDARGSRHTGIYAGRLFFRGRQYKNAVIHASCSRGITVDELTTSWMWKDYKYSVGPGGTR